MSRRLRLLALTAVLVVLVAACGDDASAPAAADPGFEPVTEAEITPGDTIPSPTGEVVLTIGGDISITNVDDRLELDMETLEAMGTVSYPVDDVQAEGRIVEFTGVLLEDVLAVAGMSADATMLLTTALNDYAVEIPVSDASESPVLIATLVDGERMPVDRFGPVRIVYPYGSHDLDAVEKDPRWIWQLASIEVS